MSTTIFRTIFVTLAALWTFSAQAENSLKISTWNMEWLTSKPSKQFPSSDRSAEDFATLAKHAAQLDSDVIAFQEVNDKTALKRVIGDEYQIFFSDRSKPQYRLQQFGDINQYTGFAIKKSVRVSDKPDFSLDSRDNSKLRFASYLMVKPQNSQPIHLLSVHLKARCSGAYNNSRDCQTLKRQGEKINQWIIERENADERYIILGDFNHNLAYRGDWFWQTMTDDTKAQLTSKKTKTLCKVKSRNNPNKTHRFRSLIDHIVASETVSLSAPKQYVFPSQDVLSYKLSDHCPLTAELNGNYN
ncbi:endonuclease/exonuclease/phosphatase family protein [Vibrio atypicus]|uniref:endonuclease/exonuclease/phosphatase family protein n=1 Tax=Vibrio atypicus TaxID=558271 RepID=UPI00135CC4EF|nr:endonuclease/exonuclease/phosphatase family protein [Vibrio atypicus]